MPVPRRLERKVEAECCVCERCAELGRDQRPLPTMLQLRYFVEVAAHGSFAAVAHHLDLHPSTVRKALDHLEVVLGQRLLERSPRAVTFTPQGQLLLPLATTVISLAVTMSGFSTQVCEEPSGSAA